MEISGRRMRVSENPDLRMSFTLFVSEPMSCTMDNWGEGVVPGYREEPLIRFDLVTRMIPS